MTGLVWDCDFEPVGSVDVVEAIQRFEGFYKVVSFPAFSQGCEARVIQFRFVRGSFDVGKQSD